MFRNLVHSLLHPRHGSRRRGREEATAKRPLKMESLEDRRLLALLEFVPDNGTETRLVLEVNEQGAFGYSDDLAVNQDFPDNNAVNSALYDPVGTLDLSGTTFTSGISIGFGDRIGNNIASEIGNITQRHFITAGYIGGRGADNGSGNNLSGRFLDESVEPNELISEFFYPNSAQNESEALLKFRLVQTLQPLDTQGAPSGVVLEQTYTVQNVSNQELHFDIIRYMDSDLYAFTPDEPGLPDTAPPFNGGGLRQDTNLQGLDAVFTTLQATNSLPYNDPTVITIRGNPIDTLGIPPGEVNRWELGRGSVYRTPDHVCWALTQGFVTLRARPDGCIPPSPWVTPAPWWKVTHHDWWVTVFNQPGQPELTFDPSPGRDQPDALPLAATLLRTIVDGDPLADAVTSTQTVPSLPLTPATPNPDDDGNDQVDVGDEYDVAMALRNIYPGVAPSQQFEYYTQTVFGHPPISSQQRGNIAGTLYSDLSGNGAQDGGEPGIEGQKVFVDAAPFNGVFDVGEPFAITDANGVYTIRNVFAGSQVVGIESDPLYRQTEPDPAVSTTLTVIVPTGSTSAGNDFGWQFLGGYVTGIKFMDLDGDRNQDAPATIDLPQSGWVIYADADLDGIRDANEVFDVTDSNGQYSLALVPGNYQIREVSQANWTQTTPPTATNANDYYPIATTAPAVGAPNQQEFNINFGNDPAPFTVSGTNWEDEFPNGVRDSYEDPMGGVAIYIDVDNDGAYDPVKDRGLRAISAADGTWSINSGDAIGPGTYAVREDLPSPVTFDQTYPSCCHHVTADPADNITGLNFGNRYRRAEVRGVVWLNPNGNSTQDPGEPGMGGVFVYIDQNKDGLRGVTEPGAVTAPNGTYHITDIRPNRPGETYHIAAALSDQNYPPNLTPPPVLPFSYYDVTLNPAQTLSGVNFGNLAPKDYGDAPNSYATTIAAGGPEHKILAGYSLGANLDGEANGIPGTLANGDDTNAVPDDEDGVVFLTALLPGQPASINVTFTQEGTLALRPPQGFVQGWIDFNRNGTFADAGEQILVNRSPVLGSNVFNFTVPAGAVAGATYARFRLGIESSLGFSGPSMAGEVEDYRVLIGPAVSGGDQIGFHRSNGFALDLNANGVWNGAAGGDGFFRFGQPTDTPISGDFNGDGVDEIGFYRSSSRAFAVDLNGNGIWEGPAGGDAVYFFGLPGDTPIIGDWNGDGTDEIGFQRSQFFAVDLNGNGIWEGTAGGDALYAFGQPGDTPIIGDWNGDGTDNIGFTRSNYFALDFNGNHIWQGTAGGDQLSRFGLPGDTPIIGDWNGDGTDNIGFTRSNYFALDFNGNRIWQGSAGGDRLYGFGQPGDTPIIGNWTLPLMAAGGVAGTDDLLPALTRDELAPIWQYAVDVWSQAPLSVEQQQALSQAEVQIADLAGARLGQARGTTITLDVDAAGYGWFVDATPGDDSEFDIPNSEFRSPQSIDLLTTVMHELGHVLGYGHGADGVMQEELAVGTRHAWGETVDDLFTGLGGD